MIKFYLGTHQPAWLPFSDVPLFISRRRLARYKNLPLAAGEWALDSGGFSELSMYGKWSISEEQYINEVRKYQTIGKMNWAAQMDWMCEPLVREKTGKSVIDHQKLTIENYLILKDKAPDIKWLPVLQGWDRDDYFNMINLYGDNGVDCRELELIGLGTVCRRQATKDIQQLIKELHDYGLKIHGFGLKILGLSKISSYIKSADSMAWGFTARREKKRLESCQRHQNCANCYLWATQWYKDVVRICIT